MAKAKDETKAEAKAEALPKGEFVTPTVIHTAKIVRGKHPRLTLQEQAARADGRLDDDGNIEEKEPTAAEKQGIKVAEGKETLYQGWISAKSIAGTTGEEISNRWYQAQPSTEDECFRSFLAYFPSAKRDKFVIDPTNSIDPTKRTYLET